MIDYFVASFICFKKSDRIMICYYILTEISKFSSYIKAGNLELKPSTYFIFYITGTNIQNIVVHFVMLKSNNFAHTEKTWFSRK